MTGEVIPNMAVRPYAVIFEPPDRRYPKVQAAIIVITAEDAAAARAFADTWLRQGPMRNTVITAVIEVRPSERSAFDAVAAIAARPEPREVKR